MQRGTLLARVDELDGARRELTLERAALSGAALQACEHRLRRHLLYVKLLLGMFEPDAEGLWRGQQMLASWSTAGLDPVVRSPLCTPGGGAVSSVPDWVGGPLSVPG